MENDIEKLKKIEHINNLMKDFEKEITSEQNLNIKKGNQLLRLNFILGLIIGLIAYFFLNVTYKYLLVLCIISIILIIFIFVRVKYVVDKLEDFKQLIILDMKKQINELKESD